MGASVKIYRRMTNPGICIGIRFGSCIGIISGIGIGMGTGIGIGIGVGAGILVQRSKASLLVKSFIASSR